MSPARVKRLVHFMGEVSILILGEFVPQSARQNANCRLQLLLPLLRALLNAHGPLIETYGHEYYLILLN